MATRKSLLMKIDNVITWEADKIANRLHEAYDCVEINELLDADIELEGALAEAKDLIASINMLRRELKEIPR